MEQGVEEATGGWQDHQYRETQGSGIIFGDFRLAFLGFLDLPFSQIEVLRSAIFFCLLNQTNGYGEASSAG